METQKKYSSIAFNAFHLEVMDIRQEEQESIMALPETGTRFEYLAESSIDAKTFMYDGRIIFCAGYKELWPGVIDCWMIPSIYVETAKIGFCRMLRNYIDDIIKEQGCHRFQTTSPDDDFHERWMRFMGMQKEGTMRQFTHTKRSYSMYSRVV